MIKVLTFCCSDCNETINGGDYESADQIFARLEEHVRKCPEATFTFDGLTLRGRELVLGDQSLSMSALWAGYGYTDRRLKQSES